MRSNLFITLSIGSSASTNDGGIVITSRTCMVSYKSLLNITSLMSLRSTTPISSPLRFTTGKRLRCDFVIACTSCPRVSLGDRTIKFFSMTLLICISVSTVLSRSCVSSLPSTASGLVYILCCSKMPIVIYDTAEAIIRGTRS